MVLPKVLTSYHSEQFKEQYRFICCQSHQLNRLQLPIATILAVVNMLFIVAAFVK